MSNYVCSELVQADNGYYMCKTWVVQQSVLSEFAITKAEAKDIALSLSGFFAVCIAFAIIAKAIKSS